MAGYIIIISGPSGVGKGTIIKGVLDRMSDIRITTSATTRKQRPNEINNKDYFFLSEEEFDHKVQNGEFLEWCIVHQNKYGTLKEEVEKYLNQGYDTILEIDIQGAKKIRQQIKNVISVFITPPTFEDLIRRLFNRKTDEEDVIVRRLSMAGKELASIGEYDYIVVNNDISSAIEDIIDIIKSVKKENIG